MTQTHERTRTKEAASTSRGEYLDLTLPYYFSDLARDYDMDLRIGDYCTVRGLGEDKKFELVDIFAQFGSCRVRRVGETTCLLIPWAYVSPWTEPKGEKTSALTQAVGNWLFDGNRVYRLEEPDRMLKQRKIHWGKETCDVEDEDGTVFHDVSWDDLEFADDVDDHLPEK